MLREPEKKKVVKALLLNFQHTVFFQKQSNTALCNRPTGKARLRHEAREAARLQRLAQKAGKRGSGGGWLVGFGIFMFFFGLSQAFFGFFSGL